MGLLVLLLSMVASLAAAVDREEARLFLETYDKEMSETGFRHALAVWDHLANWTDHNIKNKLSDLEIAVSKLVRQTWEKTKFIGWQQLDDPDMKRQFQKLSNIGSDALSENDLKKLRDVIAKMESIFDTVTICPYPGKDCQQTLEPDLINLMAESHDYDVLAHTWRAWRDNTGKKIREIFPNYVRLMNDAAKLNGFRDAGAMWREDDTVAAEVDAVWHDISPFYEHLHAYVRRQLTKKFGEDRIQEDGPIPVHLLGDLWGESWSAIHYFSKPLCEKCEVDVTPAMIRKKMTPRQMFEMAESYFVSMGLKPMNDNFWNNSILEHGWDMDCHSSAHDFHNRKDFRVKMCTRVTMEDFLTIHRQMALIEYFMHYAHQPYPFRDDPTRGFHQGVAGALATPVTTPKHLRKIGLLDDDAATRNRDWNVNMLYALALKQVPALPFAYVIDLWRWNVFRSGAKNPLNHSWWQLRLDHQGVCPPFPRSEQDMDPGSIHDVAASIPSISGFVGTIVQYQILQVLCNRSGHIGPLHRCDLDGAKEAGNLLAKMMKEGSRLPWPDALQMVTGTAHLSAGPLLDFFAPLRQWLEDENRGQVVGWRNSIPTSCPNDSLPLFEPFVS